VSGWCVRNADALATLRFILGTVTLMSQSLFLAAHCRSLRAFLMESGRPKWRHFVHGVRPSFEQRQHFAAELCMDSDLSRRRPNCPVAHMDRWPNPTVQLTATSRGLRHMLSGCSTTPSRLLLSHQSRRRSTTVSVSHFSQAAVADFVR